MNREPALATAILAEVRSQSTLRTPLHRILTAAAAVDRTAAASVGWRTRVLDAITSLSEAGEITLPKGAWDRTTTPPLPGYVGRVESSVAQRPARQAPVWHLEMAWAATLWDHGKLSESERRYLIAINSWIPHRTEAIEPMRERSLDIFDHEKTLDTIVTSRMFGPGRLTWELLASFPCWPPVEQMVLGDRAWLIVENYTTYSSLSSRAGETGFDGRIIWGSGNQVATRLSALADAPRPQRCWYFGDVDAGGFRVARSAAKRAQQLGMPALEPACGLYRLALATGKRRNDESSRRPGAATLDWIRSWATGPLGQDLAGIVEARQRIVQENVGCLVLATTTPADWTLSC
ncbi:Wadjet anti-phage system protein JetD domain-containing protein [Nocardia sp. NPDC057030]|uniref:Wadjet anti-phage system protein JetD domain-containing protein n=1 Tax=unclassified Nocardia TaxID=2637762 RepID=UPI0036349D9A